MKIHFLHQNFDFNNKNNVLLLGLLQETKYITCRVGSVWYIYIYILPAGTCDVFFLQINYINYIYNWYNYLLTWKWGSVSPFRQEETHQIFLLQEIVLNFVPVSQTVLYIMKEQKEYKNLRTMFSVRHDDIASHFRQAIS